MTDVGTASVLDPPQRAVLAAYAQVTATRSTDPLLGRGRAAHRRLVTGSLPPNRGQLLKHPRNDNLPPPMTREKTGDLFDTDVETLEVRGQGEGPRQQGRHRLAAGRLAAVRGAGAQIGLKVGIKATRSVLLCTRGGRSLT